MIKAKKFLYFTFVTIIESYISFFLCLQLLEKSMFSNQKFNKEQKIVY